MQIDTTKFYTLIAVVCLFIVGYIFTAHYVSEQMANEQKVRKEKIVNLQFKGKVVNYTLYRYNKKNCYTICVKLDTTNTQNLYVCNNLDCIKIKDGIATFSAGYLNPALGIADSVWYNMH